MVELEGLKIIISEITSFHDFFILFCEDAVFYWAFMNSEYFSAGGLEKSNYQITEWSAPTLTDDDEIERMEIYKVHINYIKATNTNFNKLI